MLLLRRAAVAPGRCRAVLLLRGAHSKEKNT
jgi:hypothetical protein